MSATADELFACLETLGIATRTVAHPPLFTVEDARAHRDGLDGLHFKNLFLKDRKGGLWLVVCLEDRRVDLNALSRRLGAPRFSFGKAELLLEVLGVSPGAVTPFALINDTGQRVRLVLDEGALAGGMLHFHPLRNDATTRIAAADLIAFCRSTGHEPVIGPIDEVGTPA